MQRSDTIRWLTAAIIALTALLAANLISLISTAPASGSVESVRLRRSGLSAVVEVRLVATSHVRASYSGIDGVLHIAGVPTDFTISGLEEGQTFVPQQAKAATITAELGPIELARVLGSATAEGKLQLRFEGALNLDVLGIGITAPVVFERTLDP